MIAGILEIQMMANLSRLSDDMRKAERVVSGSMDKVEKSVARAKSAMQSLGMGLSIGLIADQLRRTIDTYTKLDAQLRLSTKSQQSYNQALADIRRISRVAQADISGTTMLYTRLMNVMDGTGVSQKKLSTVTETVTYGLKAYGATSAEAASAALQLSQAMGANRLGGEEFRAVMEAMPNVMKVLAKSMGVSIGELRNLSIAGKITAAEMIKAWGDPAIAEQFKQYAMRAQTVTGAMTNVRNEITLLVGEFAKASGITGGTIAMFNALAEGVRITATYMKDLIQILTAYLALSIGRAVYGYVAAMIAQRAAVLAVAQAEMVRINMTYGATAATVAAGRAAVAQAAANMTLTGSIMSVGMAMQRFVLANPILIGFAAVTAAVVVLKHNFDDAVDSVGKFISKVQGMAVDALRAQRQIEVAAVASMKGSMFSGFNERDIKFAERRILILDQEINRAEKLAAIPEKALPSAKGKPVKEAHSTRMEEIAMELQARVDAEGKVLTEREKVELAYAKLLEQQSEAKIKLSKAEAKEQTEAYQKALVLADQLYSIERMRAWGDAISGAIMNGFESGKGFMQGFVDSMKSSFKSLVIEPQIKAAVSELMPAMFLKDSALTINTASLNALTAAVSGNTASQTANKTDWGSTWGWVILILAAIYKMFDMMKIYAEPTKTVGEATRSGFTGRRSIRYVSDTMGVGEFGGSTRYGTLGTLATNKLNDATLNIMETYSRAGDALGVLNTRTKDFSAHIDTSGDVVDALSTAIGSNLVPAIKLFQREGETLQETAVRLTDTFRATNDFINALGVSQGAAFGGFGLSGTASREALIAASGGLQEFTSSAQSFIKNFLTPAQQMQPALDDVGRTFARLGIQGVSTNEQFAELVRQQMALGNTDVVAQLLSVSDSFNTITTSAAAANKEIQALFNKDTFATLVDYNRALGTAGATTAASIAGATVTGASMAAQEAAGTAAYAAANQFAGPSAIEDLTQSGFTSFWQLFTDMIKSFFSKLWQGFKDLIGNIWESFKELPGKLLQAIKDAFGGAGDAIGGALGGIGDALGGIVGGIGGIFGGLFANGGAFGSGGQYAFANGGAFTNGVFNIPTPFMFANGGGFSQGVMGEAGDEAVMPLSRRNGRLGVRMDGGGSNAELVAEIQSLRAEMQAVAFNTDKTQKVLTKFDKQGFPAERVI